MSRQSASTAYTEFIDTQVELSNVDYDLRTTMSGGLKEASEAGGTDEETSKNEEKRSDGRK
ncbi:hypothetical protein MMC16_000244 [Acarospora aff. strigata]|nr:hypothetical protein [Acarospora aff. strigata]